MLKTLIGITLLSLAKSNYGQDSSLTIQLRTTAQYEIQTYEPASLGADNKFQKSNAVNYGLEAILLKPLKAINIYAGAGLFREKNNLKRFYDHRKLNGERDSLRILTRADYYTYFLIRVPLGMSYSILEKRRMKIGIGVEYLSNIVINRKYLGAKARVDNPVNSTSDFRYNGSATLVHVPIIISRFQVTPFVRVFNRFHKDEYLYERKEEMVNRSFDAFGIMVGYSINH